MKVLSEHLRTLLDLPVSCTHIKGHGGLKQSVVQIEEAIPHYQFVCKTDVKQFYESIDQYKLMSYVPEKCW